MNATRMTQLAAKIDGHLHEFEEIDLRKSDDCCFPSYGYAPTLYISGRKDSKVFDMPKEGQATVKYRVRSKSVNYDRDGGESYSTDIEVQAIDPKGVKSFGEMIAKYTELADGRARDSAGRYADGDAPPSPQDIAAAYAPKKKKAVAVGAGVATAGLLGGATALKRNPGFRNKIAAGALRAVTGLR